LTAIYVFFLLAWSAIDCVHSLIGFNNNISMALRGAISQYGSLNSQAEDCYDGAQKIFRIALVVKTNSVEYPGKVEL
jgi:hypothetical protein